MHMHVGSLCIWLWKGLGVAGAFLWDGFGVWECPWCLVSSAEPSKPESAAEDIKRDVQQLRTWTMIRSKSSSYWLAVQCSDFS